MNDQDYIRKAVEFADNFEWDADEYIIYTQYGRMNVAPDEPMFLDALAAQLVRQVDALDKFIVLSTMKETHIADEVMAAISNSQGPDRTMNTLRAIVDSEVLK